LEVRERVSNHHQPNLTQIEPEHSMTRQEMRTRYPFHNTTVSQGYTPKPVRKSWAGWLIINTAKALTLLTIGAFFAQVAITYLTGTTP
jgi:hypothetical protein